MELKYHQWQSQNRFS